LAAILISNTESRKASILCDIDAVLNEGIMTPSVAANLKGRLTFCESQHFSRCGSLLAGELSVWSRRTSGTHILTAAMKVALKLTRKIIECSKPRKIDPWAEPECIHIFTDGALEGARDEKATVGGVIFLPGHDEPRFFASAVPSVLLEHWQSRGSTKVITQVELCAVVVAKIVWSRFIATRKCIDFIDNDGTRECLVRSYSPSLNSQELLVQSVALDAESLAMHWYCRVPSPANVADDPSRLEYSWLEAHGATRDESIFPAVKELVSRESAALTNRAESEGVETGSGLSPKGAGVHPTGTGVFQ
jgi:hypothetical protein